MDGTIVDSNPVVERAWKWWAERYGLNLEELLQFSHGRPTVATMEHYFPGRDHAADLAEMLIFEETEIEGLRAIPGALEVVRVANQGKWAVVTSAWRKLAELRIREVGHPLPKVLVPVDEITRGKPDPEGYLKAAAELGVAPEDCIVFEDTVPGIEAGRSGGMRTVGLLTTASHLPADINIRDFRDLRIRHENGRFQLEFLIG